MITKQEAAAMQQFADGFSLATSKYFAKVTALIEAVPQSLRGAAQSITGKPPTAKDLDEEVKRLLERWKEKLLADRPDPNRR